MRGKYRDVILPMFVLRRLDCLLEPHLDNDDVEAFFDDLTECEIKDKYEREADKLASETLIPENEWKSVRLSTKSLPKTVIGLPKNSA